MKKYILVLKIFGIINFLFCCPASKCNVNGQSDNVIVYTIVNDSISKSRLNQLLENYTIYEVITTEGTSISVQKILVINDSSVIIQSRPDYEGFEEAVEKFRKDYFEGKVTSDDYPKREPADTLEIAFTSIQSIKYKRNTDQINSENKFRFLGGGYELDGRKKELTAGLFIENQLGLYRMYLEYNTTFNYSTDNLIISSSALYSLGYTFIGLLIGSAITGDPIISGAKKKEKNNDNTLVWVIIGLPLLVTNAEHHLYIINPSSNDYNRSVGLSVFAEFRTDIFDTNWVVYSPGAGIQIECVISKNDRGGYNNELDFQVCIEYPYEFQLNQFQKPIIAAGMKYKIGFSGV